MSISLNNHLISQNHTISEIFDQVQEQIKKQHQEIQQIQLQRQKTNEKLQKHLEKLNHLVQRLIDQQISQHPKSKQNLSNQQYKYEIQMDHNLELPCYRNRIFSIKLRLVENDKVIFNANNLLVELQIWTYDKIPKKLTHNNRNQSIYKGCQQTMIKKGYGCLTRIQIKEVSSHFPRGLLQLIVLPIDDGAVIGNESKLLIKKEWIKPLIINDVSIKAKKFSDRHYPYFAKSDGTRNVVEQN
ncbi:unnamed protein product [Paramecium sonneborni]|uniref:Uncharacterized protein n=1 Tax=Paramecium sonneborni TaxID=65129 RepID=A0A8S1NYU9_9CILI|nr:unnamed protein product [Paramecium sonneborni]CAD8095731.1 unnamed protein product [Paramecium sonneborni]